MEILKVINKNMKNKIKILNIKIDNNINETINKIKYLK